MPVPRVFQFSFHRLYPLYVAKVVRKGRSQDELDEVIRWLTGYTRAGMAKVLGSEASLESFFARAPRLNPKMVQVTGTVCGVRVEAIDDPLMRKIRCLDKLVDELARGWPLARILRAEGAAESATGAKKARAKRATPKRAGASGDDAAFRRLAERFAGQDGVTLPDAKRGAFGANGLKVDGRIFAMSVRGALAVKLPAADVEAALASGQGQRLAMGAGRVMKEWLLVSTPERRWYQLAERARAFVEGEAKTPRKRGK
jgi:TfoX/Sxy family transcriptional regulator of competence genes